MIDLEQWIIAAGEIEENRERDGQENRADAINSDNSISQSTFLLEPETSSEPDNRKPSDQRSLFGEPLPANERGSQADK